ncbi:MAG: hypothetical protein ACRD4R_16605 [Candidatus Acidiferrales bacterium]
MAAAASVPSAKTALRDDSATICAISFLAWIFADGTHEAIGHGLMALLTGAQSGVVSTVAWSSAYDSRLVAAGGPVLNLLEAAVLWIALRSAKRASPQTRYFLFIACTFCLFTATGYFLLSGVTNFGDWAQVLAGMRPHWMWQALLVVVGVVTYLLSVRAMGGALIRHVGVARDDRSRMNSLTVLPYFAALALSAAGGFMNPLGIALVLESALPAAAGGNSGLLWLRYYVPKGAVPLRGSDGVGRSYAWIATGVVLALAFIFVLGRGITLHR